MTSTLVPIELGDASTWTPSTDAPFIGWRSMIRFLQGVQKDNDDAIILTDGLEGAGKSTVAFQMARALDPTWDPETGLIIDFEDWTSVYDLKEGQVFVLDEGGDLLFSRDSMKGENKLIIRMLQMARIFNHVLIICCPNLHWVDLYVREHRALIYAHAGKGYHANGVTRGTATFHWPRRYFDWSSGEWSMSWGPIFDAKFYPIPSESEEWRTYELLKKAKVESRQADLMLQIAKNAGKNK